MNIDLKFQDWSIALPDAPVRQFDDRAQTVRVTGDYPEGWRWRLDVAVYGEAYFNAIPLTESDGALTAVLTRDDLAFGDTVYTLQLVGEYGDVTRHTNPVRMYVGPSLSGDGVWPEIPRAFTDAVHDARMAAEQAAADRSEALQKLEALAEFRQQQGGTVAQFTNVIPLSVDSGGTPYQGGAGYLDGYRIKSDGTLAEAADAFVTGFIALPQNAAEMVLRFAGVRLVSTAPSTNSRIQYYDAAFAPLCGGQTGQGTLVIAQTDGAGNITRINIAEQSEVQFIPPQNAAYFRFSAYGSGANAICTINEELRYLSGVTALSASLKPDVTIPQLPPLTARVTALEHAVDPADPLVKYADQIDRARTFGYAPALDGRATEPLVERPTLNFLHISDTHGSPNVQNAVTILNKLHADGRCAFLIHTGDMHASTFASDYTAYQGYIDAAEAPVLMVAGNHDVGNNSRIMTDGTTATDSQLYARVFAPVIDTWALTNHPEGKCYWYRDFADEGVRLIGMYDFENDYAEEGNTGMLVHKRGYAAYRQAQIDWLIQALMTCPAGYGVIIAKHNPVNLRGTLKNPFNGEFLQGQNTAQTYVDNNIIPFIVQAFMDGSDVNNVFSQTPGVVDTATLTVQQDFSGKNAGAHFICYLDGHTHADGVSFLKDYPKQLELNIGCDNFHYQHYADTLNEPGTLHQDLMNYVSVDVSRGYVYLLRIGNDFTPQGDRRDFTAIDYRNPPADTDLNALDARLAALEHPGALELINTVTFDGDTALDISTDSAQRPLRLKRAILRITMGTVASAASITVDAKYANVSVGRWYSSLSAAAGHTGMFCVWQDGAFWDSQFTSISKNVGTVSKQPSYTLRSVQYYPYIDRFESGSRPPAGTVLEVYGVRA